MKFSEIDPQSWPELQPYLDTCLLPLSGLTGQESPSEATEKVARTGEWLSPLEEAFRGRTVTMPAYHYGAGGPEHIGKINELIASWRNDGFRYVVLVCGQPIDLSEADADAYICPSAEQEEPDDRTIAQSVADLWRSRAKSAN
ncbi:DUF2487 family protein [Cohnella sp. LGH]|uniref:Uncharacterized protein DUF2487 n=1 Tax=Cohnella phaseoli TaxID=456490 RepID=A0A3D9IAB1_9BACL|nr:MULTISPECIES: DUF2487 family protein [Cohnella]QTH44882.1 DUF2487 family protein [Cohnella sp. LGH]RED58714.1 uncharacterized protein DUF2487 [Cohnella phaseoli]